MDYEFNSQKELFERVRPALRAKVEEFKRLGYSNVKDYDIWNYLIFEKWKKEKGLMLSDIVSDIMNADCKKVDTYLRDKNLESQKQQNFLEGTEIIWGEENGKK